MKKMLQPRSEILDMLKRKLEIALLFFLSLLSANALAQDSGLLGEWEIITYGFAFGGVTSHIDVTLQDENGKITGYIFGGPVEVRVNGNEFELDFDWDSLWGKLHVSTFAGRLNEDGELEGEVDHNGEANFLGYPLIGGEFTGKRKVARNVSKGLPPDPVDLAGVWNRASGQWGVRKLSYAMTPMGQSTIDEYLEMDNGNSRCASMGVMMATSMPYPMEIVPTEDYFVIVYGAEYVRRVYTDGREFPDTATSSSLGFSTGEWRGDTLIIKTTHLNPAFMHNHGKPISANAHTIEHFYIDDKGYLHADMWLHDPENYTRAPQRRRVMDRDFSPSVITKIGCDPYSFFRALYLEEQLEEFWDRAPLRR